MAQYSALPNRSWEYLPKFPRDKTQDLIDHIKVVTFACGILGVQEANVFIGIFVQSLVGNVLEWFQNLQDKYITTWDNLKERFLERFQLTIDAYHLLSNLFQIQMKESESMREFVDRFNQSVGKIPLAHQPNENN